MNEANGAPPGVGPSNNCTARLPIMLLSARGSGSAKNAPSPQIENVCIVLVKEKSADSPCRIVVTNAAFAGAVSRHSPSEAAANKDFMIASWLYADAAASSRRDQEAQSP